MRITKSFLVCTMTIVASSYAPAIAEERKIDNENIVESNSRYIKRATRHQKTLSEAKGKNSDDLNICTVGFSPATVYRLRRINSDKEQECAQIIVSKESGQAILWVKSLGKLSNNQQNLAKLTKSEATKVFGENNNSSGSFNLIGWKGDSEPSIFHIDMQFGKQGLLRAYRVRGPMIDSKKWISIQK